MSKSYIAELVLKCSKRRPDPARMLQVAKGDANYMLKRDEHILSSPGEENGCGHAGSDVIPLGDDCFVAVENSCWVRFLWRSSSRAGLGRSLRLRRARSARQRRQAQASLPWQLQQRPRGCGTGIGAFLQGRRRQTPPDRRLGQKGFAPSCMLACWLGPDLLRQCCCSGAAAADETLM